MKPAPLRPRNKRLNTEAQIESATYLSPRSPPDIPRQRSSKNDLITMIYHFVFLTLAVLLATHVIYSIIECKKLDKYLNLRTQLPTSQTPDPSVAISTPKSSAPTTPTYNSTKFPSNYFSSQSPHRLHRRATYWQFYQQNLLLGNKTCLSVTSQ